MTKSVAVGGVYTDFESLARLQGQAAGRSPAAIKAASQQFEALLLQMMLKSMREALPGDPLFGGQEQDLYQDLFDKQVSMSMAHTGTVGLADIIAKQLTRQVQTDRPSNAPATPAATTPRASAADTDAAAFIHGIWPAAKQAAAQLGVDPKVLAAQAALETGWGQRLIRKPDGRPSNNLFGIKNGSHWQGDTVSASTGEYDQGHLTKTAATFRAYETPTAGFADYVRFLKDNPRYQAALKQAGDSGRFVTALQQAGYATDPLYAEKLVGVLNGPVLASALAGLKADGKDPLG